MLHLNSLCFPLWHSAAVSKNSATLHAMRCQINNAEFENIQEVSFANISWGRKCIRCVYGALNYAHNTPGWETLNVNKTMFVWKTNPQCTVLNMIFIHDIFITLLTQGKHAPHANSFLKQEPTSSSSASALFHPWLLSSTQENACNNYWERENKIMVWWRDR